MKTAVLVLASLLFLLAPAVSQTTDDNLIVPGVRIGKWTLQMTIDDLLRMNGAASPVLHYANSIRPRDIWQYSWYSADFGAQTFDKKKVEVLVAGAGGDRSRVVPYKTDEGILLRSTRSDILKGYGKPTVVLKPDRTHYVLIYDMIGLGFRVFGEGDEGGGHDRVIWVFRPGSAKSIWKF